MIVHHQMQYHIKFQTNREVKVKIISLQTEKLKINSIPIEKHVKHQVDQQIDIVCLAKTGHRLVCCHGRLYV